MRDECAEWSDESFLDKMGLRVDGLLTYAAAILMGREEHSHLARRCNPYIRKSVRDERNVVRGSELFGTPFLLSVDRSPPMTGACCVRPCSTPSATRTTPDLDTSPSPSMTTASWS